jgi:ubiquinone/menaquinone biosynthesis C-methylase UbiE
MLRQRLRWPERIRWNHNFHYHGELLRQLPASMERALDVGCGAGEFARLLAGRAGMVDAVDASPAMIAAARASSPHCPNVNWIEGDVLSLALEPASYDAVTAIASLHHMPLDDALCRFAELVRSGGTVAILGLYRASAPADYALAATAMAAYPIVGVAKAALGRRATPHTAMPLRDTQTTLRAVADAASRQMPGAVIRRHLFFRYSLVWRRPGALTPSPSPPRGEGEDLRS